MDHIQASLMEQYALVSSQCAADDAELYGIRCQILANILSPKQTINNCISVKVDRFLFIGYVKAVTKPTERSPHIFNIVFVLNGNVLPHIVNTFQLLSKTLATAIDSEQTRCNYLADQVTTISVERDAIFFACQGGSRSYEELFTCSKLAQELRDVFCGAAERGFVHIFVNDCVEVGLRTSDRFSSRTIIPSRRHDQVDTIIKNMRPYHTVLLVGAVMPKLALNDSFRRFIDKCSPELSFMNIMNETGLSLKQIFAVVHQLIVWGNAVVIYPICGNNVYSAASYRKVDTGLSDRFSELFDNAQLSVILSKFSPPCKLPDFIDVVHRDLTQRKMGIHKFGLKSITALTQNCISMVATLLLEGVIMQLHTYLYLDVSSLDEIPSGGSVERVAEVSSLHEELRNVILSSDLDSNMKIKVAQLVQSLLTVCAREETENLLKHFVRMVPYFNGEHHLESIMYNFDVDRSFVMRIVDLFGSLLISCDHQEYLEN